MCEYLIENNCQITNTVCPFTYFCNKVNKWIPSKQMPLNCKVKDKINIPKGYYKVRMERKGFLYIDIKGQTYKIKNPFEDIPLYVKVIKLKNGEWRLKKY